MRIGRAVNTSIFSPYMISYCTWSDQTTACRTNSIAIVADHPSIHWSRWTDSIHHFCMLRDGCRLECERSENVKLVQITWKTEMSRLVTKPTKRVCAQRRFRSAWMPRLVWVFAGRTVTLLVLTCRGSNYPLIFICCLTFNNLDQHFNLGWLHLSIAV